jgi:hypothetical protein
MKKGEAKAAVSIKSRKNENRGFLEPLRAYVVVVQGFSLVP